MHLFLHMDSIVAMETSSRGDGSDRDWDSDKLEFQPRISHSYVL